MVADLCRAAQRLAGERARGRQPSSSPPVDPAHGLEPWVSDGTAAGTFLLRDIAPGPAYSLSRDQDRSEATALGSRWCSSPTAAWSARSCGSAMAPPPAPACGSTSARRAASVVAGRHGPVRRAEAVFAAIDSVHGIELWRSDGTTAGTKLLADIGVPSAAIRPRLITTVDGCCVRADDGPTSAPSCGAPTAPRRHPLVADIGPGAASGLAGAPFELRGDWRDRAVRRQRRRARQRALGERRHAGRHLDDRRPGAGTGSSQPHELRLVAGVVYFPPPRRPAATSCGAPTAPPPAPCWSRTSARPRGLGADLPHRGRRRALLRRLGCQHRLRAVAQRRQHRRNAAGQGHQARLLEQRADRRPVEAGRRGRRVVAANDGASGEELWRSDGTTAGTVLLADIRPGATLPGPCC